MKKIKFFRSESTDPCYNLATEQFLFENKKLGEMIVLLWQNDNTVVVGRYQNVFEEVDTIYAKEIKAKIVRRITGGGAVYHDLGNLNYSFIVDSEEDLAYCQETVLYSALRKLGIDYKIEGRNDILVSGAKISGCAECRENGNILHHGTLLINTDLNVLKRLLTRNNKIESQSVKSQPRQVENLSSFNRNITVKTAIKALCHDTVILAIKNQQKIIEIIDSRYNSNEWTYGFPPKYRYRNSLHYKSGHVCVNANISNGIINGIKFSGDFITLRDINILEAILSNIKASTAKEILAQYGNDFIFGIDGNSLASIFCFEGRNLEMPNHTTCCIICGKKFDEKIKPSKEHIIPEALGNTKLITYNICEKCNNSLGGNVDNYLTDHFFVKIIRSIRLDKDIQIFPRHMTDDRGDTYRVSNEKLEMTPEVSIDEVTGHVRLATSTIEEGLKIAKGILKKRLGKTDDEIETIFKDPDKFIHQETNQSKAGTFKLDVPIDFPRLGLAAIKIAYEFAVEKLGEIYTIDEDAIILRAYLKAGKDGKKEFTQKEANDILQRCHYAGSYADVLKGILDQYEETTNGHRINFLVYITKDRENKLICIIRILDENFLTFTVLLSKDANKYLSIKRDGYMAIITDDNNLFEA